MADEEQEDQVEEEEEQETEAERMFVPKTQEEVQFHTDFCTGLGPVILSMLLAEKGVLLMTGDEDGPRVIVDKSDNLKWYCVFSDEKAYAHAQAHDDFVYPVMMYIITDALQGLYLMGRQGNMDGIMFFGWDPVKDEPINQILPLSGKAKYATRKLRRKGKKNIVLLN